MAAGEPLGDRAACAPAQATGQKRVRRACAAPVDHQRVREAVVEVPVTDPVGQDAARSGIPEVLQHVPPRPLVLLEADLE